MEMYRGIYFCVAMLATGPAVAEYGLAPYVYEAIADDLGPVAIGDVTGDGRNDVVLTTVRPYYRGVTEVLVLEQLPDGSLAAPLRFDYGPAALISGLALADLNRDRVQDIVVGTDVGITLFLSQRHRPAQAPLFKVLEVDGTASATMPTGASAADIVVLDVNRDGILDIVGQSEWFDAVIYFGNGKGGIASTSPLQTRMSGSGQNDLKSADVNGDGFPDLLITSPMDKLRVLYHNGVAGYDGPPIEYGSVHMSWGLATGDFNNDGRDDVATTREYALETEPPYFISLFLQQPSGQLAGLQMSTLASAWTALGDDLDGDGRDDLLLVHDNGAGAGTAISYYLQGPTGLTEEHWVAQPSGALTSARIMATGDINGDRCKDVVTTNYLGGAILIFRGQGCEPADLAVAIAADASSVTVGLAATSDAPIESPLTRIEISVADGTLHTGILPPGCTVQRQALRSRSIDCLSDTLPPGAVSSLTIPFSTSGAKKRTLTVIAHARTNTPELDLRNNRAWKQTRMSAVANTSGHDAAGKRARITDRRR
jgi:hypothetical protein